MPNGTRVLDADEVGRTSDGLGFTGYAEAIARKVAARHDVRMARIQSFDHVGVTVADLDGAIDFFVSLGLEVEGRQFVEGEFLDTVIGIPDARTEIAMLRPPGGGTALELSTCVRPAHVSGARDAMATQLGLRNVCFVVDDLRGELGRLAADGYGLVGDVGNHENTWLMAYVRGPEGIIVSLTERIG